MGPWGGRRQTNGGTPSPEKSQSHLLSEGGKKVIKGLGPPKCSSFIETWVSSLLGGGNVGSKGQEEKEGRKGKESNCSLSTVADARGMA